MCTARRRKSVVADVVESVEHRFEVEGSFSEDFVVVFPQSPADDVLKVYCRNVAGTLTDALGGFVPVHRDAPEVETVVKVDAERVAPNSVDRIQCLSSGLDRRRKRAASSPPTSL